MRLLPYSQSAFAEALSNEFTSETSIKLKYHFLYFLDYLGESGLKAKSIVVEDNYISKDYLDDFTEYYASCFTDFGKKCKRVHFFSSVFNEKKLKEYIISGRTEQNSEFWNSYLGFIVVKPIPNTVIGLTVLKTYKNDETHHRDFFGVRNYIINFFGNQLIVESLAFQEQDNVLAACATTAIWSMLHKASLNNHTVLKSPSQITKDADNTAADGSRLFPNSGLNLLQICQAIQRSGLVCELKQNDIKNGPNSGFLSVSYLKKLIYAYAPVGVPIILGIQVPNGVQHGKHAIAITGFNLNWETSEDLVLHSDSLPTISEKIDKIYAHDDQWGPFARIELENHADLLTPWSKHDGEEGRSSKTLALIIPLYPKIRISFEHIESLCLGLNSILELFLNQTSNKLIWEIKLQYSEEYKEWIKKSVLSDSQKIEKITSGLPKYLWIANCSLESEVLFTFSFDATALKNSMIGIDAICFYEEIREPFIAFLNEKQSLVVKSIKNMSRSEYVQFFITQLNVK